MKVSYKNNLYTVIENLAGVFRYEVSRIKGKKPPATLFKYYSLSKNSLNVLSTNQIWVSEPEDFNDLFDSKYFLSNLDNIDFSTFKKLISNTLPLADINDLWLNRREVLIEQCAKANYSITFSRLGIFSMSSSYENELLWGYYTGNQGFCIEFKYSKFPSHFQGPFPIIYVEVLKPVDYMKYGGLISMLIQTTQKKSIWQFEDEYRFLVECQNGLYKLKPSMLSTNINQSNSVDRTEIFDQQAIIAIYLGFTFIKDECTHNYTTCFISSEREQKVLLLDEIIRKKLKCYIMEKETDMMVLKRKRIEINKISDFKYIFAEIEESES